MAKVLVQDANLLLLDEPTNHLDLLTKQVLADALASYQGTLVFVSHDRDVVEKVATSIVAIEQGRATLYPGTYESFIFAREQNRTDAQRPLNLANVPDQTKPRGGALRQARKDLARIEREIAKCEEREQKLAEELGQYEYATSEYNNVLSQYEKIRSDLTKLHAEWEKVYEQTA